MIDFKEIIAKKINNIVNLDETNIYNNLEIPPKQDMGDYAFPCFVLSKELKKSPQIIAEEIKDKIELDFYIKIQFNHLFSNSPHLFI